MCVCVSGWSVIGIFSHCVQSVESDEGHYEMVSYLALHITSRTGCVT